MKNRHRIAAWLHIAAGTFVTALVAIIWICAELLTQVFDGTFIPEAWAMFGRPAAITLLAFTVMELLAGIALLRERLWARWPLLFVSAFQVAIVPIGTLLAMYSVWALLSGIPRVAHRRPIHLEALLQATGPQQG